METDQERNMLDQEKDRTKREYESFEKNEELMIRKNSILSKLSQEDRDELETIERKLEELGK